MIKLNNNALLPYRIILSLLFPLIIIYTIYRAIKDGGIIYFLQRLGFAQPRLKNSIWFHCASVGEVNTALGVIQAFQNNHPDTDIIVSTNTPTGKTVLLKKLPNIVHCYCPLDYPSLIKETLKKLSPQALLLIETELWPELIEQCHQQKISSIIYNARLTDKTLHTYAWLKQAYAVSIAKLSFILCKSLDERQRFITLGAKPELIETLGSLKFANTNLSKTNATPAISRSYWLAASTHDDEERLIYKAWQFSKRTELLVIAPRYPDRGARIEKQLSQLGFWHCERRSQHPTPSDQADIYIVDTFGELPSLIQGCQIVFVGGSLIPRGGQNIIEPAQLGAAVIVGPSMENFKGEFKALASHNAIIQVDDASELIQQVTRLLKNPQLAEKLGNAAKARCAELSDIDQRYYERLSKLLYPSSKASQPS